jgi:hypothetical protein
MNRVVNAVGKLLEAVRKLEVGEYPADVRMRDGTMVGVLIDVDEYGVSVAFDVPLYQLSPPQHHEPTETLRSSEGDLLSESVGADTFAPDPLGWLSEDVQSEDEDE